MSALPGSWLRWWRLAIPRGATRRALLAPALAAARQSRGLFARLIAVVLNRALLVGVTRLPVNGFTWPLLPTNLIGPVIVVEQGLLDAALLDAGAALMRPATRRINPAPTATEQLARVLLHEGAHHCLVIWPEWRNWVNTLARLLLFFIKWRNRSWPVFPHERIYGVGVNSADTLAERIITQAQARGWDS